MLLVTLGLLLTNLWVWLKAHLAAAAPRRARPRACAWLEAAFRFDRFRDLLIEAPKAHYHVHVALPYPFALSTPIKL